MSRQAILLYNDYRKYLRDFLEEKKKVSQAYSMRNFCKRVGFSSNCYISAVIKGERNLSHKSIMKILPELKLNRLEEEYFVSLVHANQAKRFQDKVSSLDKLKELAKKIAQNNKKYENLDLVHAEVLEDYVSIVILELADSQIPLIDDPLEISRKFLDEVSPQRIRKSINKLIKAHLLVRENRLLRSSQPMRATSPEIHSVALTKLHMSLLELSKRSLCDGDPSEREIEALFIKISQTHLPQYKRSIYEFLKDLAHRSEQDLSSEDCEQGGQQIYSLNVQLIPLTRETQTNPKI